MKIIGLTGGSGAGKGEVCRIFAGYGLDSIDTDEISRGITGKNSACLAELTRYFSGIILNSCGELDRKKLAELAFSDKNNLEVLNKITHKYILEECMRRIKAMETAGKTAVIIDAPLLFESGFDGCCDIIISVTAQKNERIKRIISRDNLSLEQAVRRIENQKDDDFFSAHSDYIIKNNGTPEELEKQIYDIYTNIFKTER